MEKETIKHEKKEVHSEERKKKSNGETVVSEKHEFSDKKYYGEAAKKWGPAIEAPQQSSSKLCKK